MLWFNRRTSPALADMTAPDPVASRTAGEEKRGKPRSSQRESVSPASPDAPLRNSPAKELLNHERFTQLATWLGAEHPFLRDRAVAGLRDLARDDPTWAHAVEDVLAALKRQDEAHASAAISTSTPGNHRAEADTAQREHGDRIIAETRRRINSRGISFGYSFVQHEHGCDACQRNVTTTSAYNGAQPIWRLCADCLAEARHEQGTAPHPQCPRASPLPVKPTTAVTSHRKHGSQTRIEDTCD